LSSALKRQGVFDEAGDLQDQVFKLSAKIFGPQHPFTSNARRTLSYIWDETDSHQASLNLAQFLSDGNDDDMAGTSE